MTKILDATSRTLCVLGWHDKYQQYGNVMRHKWNIVLILIATLICTNVSAGGIYRHPIAAFNAIEARGNFNIHITRGKKQYVQMNEEATEYVNIWDEGGVLYLENVDPKTRLPSKSKAKGYPPTTVNISIPYLDALTLSGDTSIIGNRIRSNGLTIDAQDNSYVLLNGDVDVNKLTLRGNSHVAIRWVDSGNLKIFACDNAQIYLAGVARILQARLWGHAHLDAKYLRPQITMVQVRDDAIADVLAIHSLYAFAEDRGNINYYKSPRYSVAFTENSGNVLQLARWR